MDAIHEKNLNWILLEKENVTIGENEKLRFEDKLSIIHARLKPGQEMTTHYHERPESGHEIYFFYSGGNFVFLSDGKPQEFNTKEPLYLSFKNNLPTYNLTM